MLHLLIQTCAAAMATIGFSMLFSVPARYYPSCALIGGVSWLAYLLLLPYSSVSIATFAATVIVILMSRWFAVRKRCPVTIFLISGIIPLVPGIALTNGVRDIAGCDYLSGTIRGIEALLIGAAIALGVGFVLGASAALPGVIVR